MKYEFHFHSDAIAAGTVPEEGDGVLVACANCGAPLPMAANMKVEHDCETGYVGPA